MDKIKINEYADLKEIDLLNRMVANEEENDQKNSKLRFGKEWCHRIFRRHDFSNRRGTAKMREEFPVDYEVKKDNFILHYHTMYSHTMYSHIR